MAIVDDNVKMNQTQELSKRYLEGLYREEAQRIIGESGYRPSDEKILQEFSDKFDLDMKLWTIDDFGGWQKAYELYFDDDALFDQIYEY